MNTVIIPSHKKWSLSAGNVELGDYYALRKTLRECDKNPVLTYATEEQIKLDNEYYSISDEDLLALKLKYNEICWVKQV